jgi:hypothetical protein
MITGGSSTAGAASTMTSFPVASSTSSTAPASWLAALHSGQARAAQSAGVVRIVAVTTTALKPRYLILIAKTSRTAQD